MADFLQYVVIGLGNGAIYAMLGLGLVVIFLASVLVGRAAVFEKLRQNRKTWLAVVILLATVIVMISGYLKVRPPAPRTEPEGRIHLPALMNHTRNC